MRTKHPFIFLASIMTLSGLSDVALPDASAENRAAESAAQERFRVQYHSQWSDTPPANATIAIEYSAAEGLGREVGIIRRDPTDIIKMGDTYFLWYTRSAGGPLRVGVPNATDTLRAYPWDLGDIWLATSKDGIQWQEQGPAVVRGEPGTYDARSVFTPNILVSKGKYYLFYQTAPNLDDPDPGDFKWTKIGMSWADSPYGPWHRAPAPVLSHGDYEKGEWDALVAHDPSVIERDGRYFLYYKSRYHRGPDQRFAEGDLKDWVAKGGIPIGWGVAVANNPKGPYVKSELNPVIIGGHECIVWPHQTGVCALVTQGPEKNTIQYAADAINFAPIGTVKEAPIAAGLFRTDFSDTDDSSELDWGISHVVTGTDWHHLRRFEFTEPLNR
ncbi:hypothetical protein FHS27_001565 [Rhodopirellula rubra]|uniref:Glycosyl hydrolases family 43 n=1 Tax=Aporhodopirellula rubra TaxID=980271 RepID=A0A7W5H5E7_9BACT|nr:family 43 glycosylhydrolase [Aporhodopirellula rubra]MBB3205761.1 hypothetical protein [Aporhodopirellula rubra]